MTIIVCNAYLARIALNSLWRLFAQMEFVSNAKLIQIAKLKDLISVLPLKNVQDVKETPIVP